LLEETLEKPVFAPLKDGLEYCVLIKWETGAQSRVNHFACVSDAQRWIDHESDNWFRGRVEALAERSSFTASSKVVLAFTSSGAFGP
jgi:hypothetical protein